MFAPQCSKTGNTTSPNTDIQNIQTFLEHAPWINQPIEFYSQKPDTYTSILCYTLPSFSMHAIYPPVLVHYWSFISFFLEAHDALHHFSCKMLTPRHCSGSCSFKSPLLPPWTRWHFMKEKGHKGHIFCQTMKNLWGIQSKED